MKFANALREFFSFNYSLGRSRVADEVPSAMCVRVNPSIPASEAKAMIERLSVVEELRSTKLMHSAVRNERANEWSKTFKQKRAQEQAWTSFVCGWNAAIEEMHLYNQKKPTAPSAEGT